MLQPKAQIELFLIVVAGLPGTGKTTLAKALADSYGWISLHKDEFKERLWDKSLGQKDNESLGMESIEALLTTTEKELSLGKNCIVEAPFRFSSDHIRIRRISEQFKTRVISFICELNDRERQARIEQRKQHRHAAHHDNLVTNAQIIDWSLMPGKVVYLDMRKNLQDLLKEAQYHLIS